MSFLVSLLITYINPYIQNEPGNLGSRIGMVYGSVSVIAIAFVAYLVPEMKGRSLEEIAHDIVQRNTRRRTTARFTGDTNEGRQLALVPGVSDPSLWQVRVKVCMTLLK